MAAAPGTASGAVCVIAICGDELRSGTMDNPADFD